jgi:UDP-glucuronate decarboxylase
MLVVQICVMHTFNTYWPRMLPHDGQVVSIFIVQALRCVPLTFFGDGRHTGSSCYGDELIEAMIRLINGSRTGPINIANPGDFTIRQLAELLRHRINLGLTLIERPPPAHDPLRRQPVIDWQWRNWAAHAAAGSTPRAYQGLVSQDPS